MTLKDAWHENYYLPTGEVNPECRLFAGWKKQDIEKYLQNRQEGI